MSLKTKKTPALSREDIILRDEITGRRGRNPLNKKHLSQSELDEIFGE